MTITIRPAVADDVPQILRLVDALAAYENEPLAVKATVESLGTAMFGPDAHVWAHLAERDGRPVGVALWFLTYSTWTGRPSLYLEDFFVDAEARGLGAGVALFRALAREAKARDCARIDWSVLDWNNGAKGFYRKLGGRRAEAWESWRLEGPALDALAV